MEQTVGLSAMVFTVTELVKDTGLDTKWSPLVALAVSLALSFVVNADKPLAVVIGNAIISAGFASGVQSGSKALLKK